MPLNYAEARAKLEEWTAGNSLRTHAQTVALAMRQAAHRYGQGATDETAYAVAGLIHDADYEQWPDQHPHLVVAWLREQGEDAIADAVAAHVGHGLTPCNSLMARCLLACDELTGFIVACALVRPDGILSLTPAGVRKKLKDKTFAAKIDRTDVLQGAEQLQVPLDDHIQMIIDALRPEAASLGLAGKGA